MAPSHYQMNQNVDLSSKVICDSHLWLISQEVHMDFLSNMCSEITLLKLLLHVPGANELTGQVAQKVEPPPAYNLFYHDVGEIWWPQPIRLLKMGHVTGQGSTTTTWVGRVSDLGKSSFHKMCKKI